MRAMIFPMFASVLFSVLSTSVASAEVKTIPVPLVARLLSVSHNVSAQLFTEADAAVLYDKTSVEPSNDGRETTVLSDGTVKQMSRAANGTFTQIDCPNRSQCVVLVAIPK